MSECLRCRECQLMSGKRPWSFAVSAFSFEGKDLGIGYQFKYRKETCFGAFFATHLAEAWRKYRKWPRHRYDYSSPVESVPIL